MTESLRVLVAGSHGQVGQHITELLGQSDHEVRGMVRDEAQVTDIEALGAETVVADVTADVRHAVRCWDAIIFAAGSGEDDVWDVDRNGAINLIEAAETNGVHRFVMLSTINSDTPERSPDKFQEYLEAKAEADDRLRNSRLTYTIVRPGTFTDAAGTGQIRTGTDLTGGGEILRADVAQTLVTALTIDSTHGQTFELLAGTASIKGALEDPLTPQ